MSVFYRLLAALLIISSNAAAYSGPKGLYVLEYPVNMPDVSVISENNIDTPILNTNADLTIMIFWAITKRNHHHCNHCLKRLSIQIVYSQIRFNRLIQI